ncbi:hypothetical protein EG329_003163 [Mollisiaceae sp. DMI_Dod_QoI]|nr:hypothetical protein EG329_003163 [Helotiales sp. DMI_Dod_QoI]
MELYRQPQVNSTVRQLRGKGNTPFDFTTPDPDRHVIQRKHPRSVPDDAEFDSKSVQVPSLLTDDSSRESTINNPECPSVADEPYCWFLHKDGDMPVFERSLSPVSAEESNFRRTSMSLRTPPDRQAYDAQRRPDIPNGRDTSMEPQSSHLISSGEPLSTSSAIGDSNALVRQVTLGSELSDSDSESEDDSGSDDIDNDEWSGANDNIEAAIYQAVYPDIDLAAYLISTMYPALVISYRNKITRKVSSWQEKNITTCGTDSGTASTTKESVPQGTSNTGNKSSPKRNRQCSSPDDNIGDDEDDEADESRRKRPKEQPGSEPGIPTLRFACPFYKKDPERFSAVEGTGNRSSAVSELVEHMQQEIRCVRRPSSLKEGINDVEWSRLSEEKKKNRKGKSKDRVTSPEQTPSSFEQWNEIWAVLFPDEPHPPTPCYSPSHPRGLAHNKHWLDVSKNVNEQKLSAIKDAVFSGSDEALLALLLECDQRKFAVYRATIKDKDTSDTTTGSLINIEENDLHSSGSWERVPRDANPPQQSSSQPATKRPLPTSNFATQIDHSTPGGTSNPAEAVLDGREISMGGKPQTSTPNAPYAHREVQAPLQQLPSQTATTPAFQDHQIDTHNNHSARAGMGMNRNPQNIPQSTTYSETSQASGNYNQSGYPHPTHAAYSGSSTEYPEPSWLPDVYGMRVPGDFDMASFTQDHLPWQNFQ